MIEDHPADIRERSVTTIDGKRRWVESLELSLPNLLLRRAACIRSLWNWVAAGAPIESASTDAQIENW